MTFSAVCNYSTEMLLVNILHFYEIVCAIFGLSAMKSTSDRLQCKLIQIVHNAINCVVVSFIRDSAKFLM